MLVKLMKKESTYIDKKDNQEKKATRFYLECGTSLVPIEPTYFENVEKAIYACISNCELKSMERVGNTIEIVVAHHDGRNCFTLVFLSDKGHERYMRNGKVSLNNRENIKKIGEYIF